ncbi:MAG: hypothetical protein ACOYON_09420 [Fimbriimonas sp.]
MKPDLDLYFTRPVGSVELPLSVLVPTRARPEGIANAAERMDLAAIGQFTKRAPIQVADIGSGKYEIVDGNSTYAVAAERGWETIRCQIVTRL